jgi:hypothetical protein
MNQALKKSSLFVKMAWLVITIFVVMMTGPIKKLVEIRLDNSGIVNTTQDEEKKLKTWHREKRDYAPAIHLVAHDVADDALAFVFVSSFVALLLAARPENGHIPTLQTVALQHHVPRYLQCRKLLV